MDTSHKRGYVAILSLARFPEAGKYCVESTPQASYAQFQLLERKMNSLARRVVTRSKGRVVGHFFSYRNQQHLQWEPQLERDCMRVLDVLPDVGSFSEQPFPLRYMCSGKEMTYYPDLLVTRAGRQTVIEVKPYEKAITPEAIEKFNNIESALAELGISFEVWTEKEIRSEPRWSNVILLMSTQRQRIELPADDVLVELFSECSSLSLRQLSKRLRKVNARGQALSLVSAGKLVTDLDQPITRDSLIWLPERECVQ